MPSSTLSFNSSSHFLHGWRKEQWYAGLHTFWAWHTYPFYNTYIRAYICSQHNNTYRTYTKVSPSTFGKGSKQHFTLLLITFQVEEWNTLFCDSNSNLCVPYTDTPDSATCKLLWIWSPSSHLHFNSLTFNWNESIPSCVCVWYGLNWEVKEKGNWFKSDFHPVSIVSHFHCVSSSDTVFHPSTSSPWTIPAPHILPLIDTDALNFKEEEVREY